jgi:hypothetical protein
LSEFTKKPPLGRITDGFTIRIQRPPEGQAEDALDRLIHGYPSTTLESSLASPEFGRYVPVDRRQRMGQCLNGV